MNTLTKTVSSYLFLCALLVVFSAPGAQALGASGTTTIEGLVAGPPPSTPPTVENITPKTTFSTKSILLKGSCIAGLVVKAYRNNIFAGSTLCQTNGMYSLRIDLFVGKNVIFTRQFDMAGQASPDAPAFTVYYAPETSTPTLPDDTGTASNGGGKDDGKDSGSTGTKTTPTPNQSGSDNPAPAQSAQFQLLIKYDYTLQAVFAHQPFHLPISFTGGTGPYAVNIDWGDGNNDVVSRDSTQPFTVDHTYNDAGYRTATISVSDKNGEKASLQFVLLVNGEQEQFLSNVPFLGSNTTWEKITLGAGAALLLVTTFLFGLRLGKIRAPKP